MESNHRATSAAASSSVSMDGSKAELVGKADSDAGFTVSASNGLAFPDLKPYAPSNRVSVGVGGGNGRFIGEVRAVAEDAHA